VVSASALSASGPTADRNSSGPAARLARWILRGRNEVFFIGVSICVIEGILEHERPLDLLVVGWQQVLAVLLIMSGVGLRIGALGCIRGSETLESRGVYSLCRHPRYLGTVVAYVGFCFLMNDDEFWYFGLGYFAVFYTVLIWREDAKLRAKYPAECEAYQRRTPLLLPVGRPMRGCFAWSQARQRGGLKLILGVLSLLVGVELMNQVFRPGILGANDPPDSLIGIVER
jgi:protein-S-isoprenylcysteine O-methyltransferase Ste14